MTHGGHSGGSPNSNGGVTALDGGAGEGGTASEESAGAGGSPEAGANTSGAGAGNTEENQPSHGGAGGEHTGSEHAGDTGTTTRFYEDLAPILYENCVSCHQPGSVAPFSLVDYASAAPYAHAMAHAVQERHMPPMPVDNSGLCNTYSNARWLSDREIDTFVAWAEQGAAEGDPASAPELPAPPPELSAPDVTLDPGVEYSPSTRGADDYRCFVLPSPLTSRGFITAYQVLPGEPRVVHHVIVYQPTTSDAVSAARTLDAQEEGPGYTCFGGPGTNAAPIALWAPGGGFVEMPSGTGIPLEPGRDLILQVHYNVASGSLPDRTRVELAVATSGVTPARFMPVANTGLTLVPDRAYQETEASQRRVINAPIVVYGAAPHMHTRGKTLLVNFTSGGVDRCMVSVDRWHFHWQNLWWYSTPIALNGLEQVSIRCGYDTRGLTQPVFWGEGTQDEMCLSYFYVTGLD